MIAEVFYAIQAEGRLAGIPAVFLRTGEISGPPLWCGSREGVFTPDAETTFAGLLSSARKHWADYAVIAGGEPFRQPDLAPLAEALRKFGHFLTLETTGAHFAELPCDLVSVRISLREPAAPIQPVKGGPAPEPYNLDVLRHLAARYDCQFKFQLTDRAEMQEVRSIVQDALIDKTKVLLLPAASKGSELSTQLLWMSEASHFFGYRLAPRLLVPATPKAAKKQAAG